MVNGGLYGDLMLTASLSWLVEPPCLGVEEREWEREVDVGSV